MIKIKEVSNEEVQEFWEEHIKYLINDELIFGKKEIDYYSGEEYRKTIESYRKNKIDKLHMVWFMREGVKIGATHYKIFKNEDGECFILDFWVFPEYRGHNTGHECFNALKEYTEADGARYYKLNAAKEQSIHFWKTIGFVEFAMDPNGETIFIKK